MVQTVDTNSAFARAIENADSETLISAITEWFDKPYRNPTNALDIAVCVSAAIHAGFAHKIAEARRAWRIGEADTWEQSRIAFDAAMCAAVEAVGRSPNPEPQHDPPPSAKWGKGPAIGRGWGNQTA